MTEATASVSPQADQGMAQTDLVKLFLGFSGMVIGQFMAILDIQIVAASLNEVQAGIDASADEIAWVQTAYLLAEVVIMPVTAYMMRLWGTQRTFMTCCVLFLITSVMAGFATSIETMILTRTLQGLAAGAMIPSVFATAFTAFPKDKQLSANIVVGMIVTLAPSIGPSLGGWITDTLSWRWLFFMNVIPGMLVLFLVGRWGDFDKGDPSLAKGVDWWGLVAMSISLLAIQFVLEEGAENNWFSEDYILWLTVLGLLTGAAFIWRQLAYRQPLLNLRLFANRNFSLGILMTFVSGISLFGGTFILPLYLGGVRDLTASQIGTVMLVSGVAMFVSSPICRLLLKFIPTRFAIFGGYMLTAYAVSLGGRINGEWGFYEFMAFQAIRGFGIMVAMVAAQQLTVSMLQPHQMKDASAIVNVMRNLGGALGLAVLSTVLTVQGRSHFSDLSSRISQSSVEGQALLEGLTRRMTENGVADPVGAANTAFAGIMERQAAILAFGDAFYALAASAALAAFFVLFARIPKSDTPLPAGAH